MHLKLKQVPVLLHRHQRLNNSMQKLFSLSLLALLLSLSFSATPSAFAATPTPSPKSTATASAKPSPSASTTTSPSPEATSQPATQSLKERIQRVVQQNQDKIKGVIDTMGRRPRGFIGEISRVTEEAISVTTPKGTEIVAVNSGLPILKAGKLIKSTDIVVGDWATVIGYAENDSFMPRKVILSATPIIPGGITVVIGSIQEVTGNTLTIQPRSVGSSPADYTVTKNSTIQDLTGSDIKQAAIKEQIQALIVASEDAKGVKTIKTIRLLTTVEPSPSPTPATKR